ncbi:MAG: hypothetical protein Q4G58_07285 [bacterium]|nr:hypothetical protein [bacterium]
MKRNLFVNFIICGCVGWCFECFFSGLNAIIQHKDAKLVCHSSVWMFPIYGLAAFISPISKRMRHLNIWLRGGIYTIGIFCVEFLSGLLLKKYKCCPWDYSNAKCNLLGVIRLDYAPLWFIVGLLYERLTSLSLQSGQ